MTSVLVEELLVHGTIDWVSIGMVWQIVRDAGPAPEEVQRSAVSGLLAEVVLGRLMVPGQVSGGSFHPWSLEPPEAVARLIAELQPVGLTHVRPGDIAWLCNTPEGDAIGDAVGDRSAGDS